MEDQRKRALEDLVAYFTYAHLPPHLQEKSKPFFDLAVEIAAMYDPAMRPGSYSQLIGAVSKILEAKDCFVRSGL